jgi:uncharacterized protein (TIGR03437 family)
MVESVTPAWFTANANGQGAPAAVVFRLKADGAQSTEPVVQFNSTTNRFEATPIDLGPEAEQVFVIGFGTGFRNRSSLNNVTCTIGGVLSEVSFAGAQGDLAGWIKPTSNSAQSGRTRQCGDRIHRGRQAR